MSLWVKEWPPGGMTGERERKGGDEERQRGDILVLYVCGTWYTCERVRVCACEGVRVGEYKTKRTVEPEPLT